MISRVFLTVGVVSLIVGCANVGPMQTSLGPVNTPVFEPIALDAVGDSSSKLLFKSPTAIMYKNGKLEYFMSSVFVITEKGAYAASWDTNAYQYNLVARVPSDSITDVYYKTEERSLLPDIDLIVIKQTNKEEIGFSIRGSGVAKIILEEISAERHGEQ